MTIANQHAEISDEELEQRMRRALFLSGPSNRGQQLSETERRMAAKLIGTDNVERLQNRRPERRFRPIPVRVHYEYWWFEGSDYHAGGYRIVRIENGRQIDHKREHKNLQDEIAALRKKGFSVREVTIGLQSPAVRKPSASGSSRSLILKQLRDFRV